MITETTCRILIVDDEVLIRQGIKYYLDWEKEGFEIIGEAANGKEALDLLEDTQPHILLTDIVMPIMDGEELTRIVKERYPNIEIIILSSFSEYEYVRSTFQSGIVDYILKPKLNSTELLQVLNQAKKRIPNLYWSNETVLAESNINKLVNKLMSGYQISLAESEYIRLFPNDSFYLLGVHTEKEESEMLVKKYITNHMSSSPVLTYYSISVGKYKQLYLINLEKSNARFFQESFKGAIEEEKPKQATYILSNLYTDFFQTSAIYVKQIEKLYSLSFYYPDISLVLAEKWINKELDISSFNQERFNKEWKNKNFQVALTYLRSYMEEYSTCYKVEITEFKGFFHKLLFDITVMLENMESKEKEMLEERRNNYFNKIASASSAKETISYFYEFIEEIKDSLLIKSPVSNHMKRLITYIEEHYSQPLTLTELAAHFHFNPSYLSNYFSSHYKESFIELLNRVRIEEASKLLKNKDISIAEISGIVGYADQSYFCKVFKKRKGMSPSHYRRTIK
ncbi:response regulator transcription factor [Bacillus sp. B1-b2]|uniref:response regulator transcription factor n=1 Tax=Bacillus sp. B1-b2 TaxID=2653201 RepID=UPI00126288C7|nr:response regulator transcription factor [Bacillus sp. B1-b2]KAB7666297.1 response regulator transcription factor [Bacillus sp. B1-b2]